MEYLQILIVDDQILFAESLKYVLENDAPDIKVVDIAHHGGAAIEYVKRARPDLILMDVRMPNTNGVKATQIIHKMDESIKIIMLTTFDDDEYVHQAVKFGASGYLLKDISPFELIISIRAVMAGNVLLSPTIVKKFVEEVPQKETNKTQYENNPFLSLNKRENDILELLLQGKNNKEIAELLFLGQQTVKNYISCIYGKLNVKNRIHAIKLAADFDYSSMRDESD